MWHIVAEIGIVEKTLAWQIKKTFVRLDLDQVKLFHSLEIENLVGHPAVPIIFNEPLIKLFEFQWSEGVQGILLPAAGAGLPDMHQEVMNVIILPADQFLFNSSFRKISS